MRKEVVLILLVLLFAPFIFANGENDEQVEKEGKREKPVFSLSFHARLRATLYNSSQHADIKQTYHSGGGLFAFDHVKGFKRVELFMKAQGGNVSALSHYIHSLDRYDLQHTFEINYNRTCRKSDLVGKIQHPFHWVHLSSFTGESTFNGQVLENWEYVHPKTGRLYRVAVKKGTNIPVVVEMGDDFVKGKNMKLELIVLEWNKKVRPHMLSYVPVNCMDHVNEHLLGDVNGVVDFADNNWQCADPACDQTVPAGSGQPNYGCAEFAARSLAAGGFIPGLGPLDAQSSYGNWGYNGNTYNLNWCSSLSQALSDLGFTSEAADPDAVNAGCAAFGDGGDGDWSHAVIGVAPGTDDAHNNARYHYPVKYSLFNGVDAVQCPPGVSPGTGGSYYSYKNQPNDVEVNGGNGVIYDNKESNKVMDKSEYLVDAEPAAVVDDVRVFEEKTNKKFE